MVFFLFRAQFIGFFFCGVIEESIEVLSKTLSEKFQFNKDNNVISSSNKTWNLAQKCAQLFHPSKLKEYYHKLFATHCSRTWPRKEDKNLKQDMIKTLNLHPHAHKTVKQTSKHSNVTQTSQAPLRDFHVKLNAWSLLKRIFFSNILWRRPTGKFKASQLGKMSPKSTKKGVNE